MSSTSGRTASTTTCRCSSLPARSSPHGAKTKPRRKRRGFSFCRSDTAPEWRAGDQWIERYGRAKTAVEAALNARNARKRTVRLIALSSPGSCLFPTASMLNASLPNGRPPCSETDHLPSGSPVRHFLRPQKRRIAAAPAPRRGVDACSRTVRSLQFMRPA